MIGIRGHFDGKVIVLDEPVDLPPQAEVIVLANAENKAVADQLEAETREYYQTQTAEDAAEDEDWARAFQAHPQVWNEE